MKKNVSVGMHRGYRVWERKRDVGGCVWVWDRMRTRVWERKRTRDMDVDREMYEIRVLGAPTGGKIRRRGV